MKRTQGGFSLVELIVALTVTLMVTGAIYKLVTAGQSAFRREPALADRQQNVRAAMDRVSRDVFNGGTGLPEWMQVFTTDLDAKGPIMGSGGVQSDMIEFASVGNCPPSELCKINGDQLTMKEAKPTCMMTPGELLFASPRQYHLVTMKKPGNESNDACKSGGAGKNGHMVVDEGNTKLCPDATGGNNKNVIFTPDPAKPAENACPLWVMTGEIVRYRINTDVKGVPNLERSGHGVDGPWEIVAAGIEDFQVQYRHLGDDWLTSYSDGTWSDVSGQVVEGNPQTLVQRVRIAMSARVVSERNLAGQTKSAAGGDGVRGQLVSEITPRAAQTFLSIRKNEE